MITISYWAKQNVWAAQVILTICLILLIVTGAEFGIFLKSFGTTLPSSWVHFFALFGFLILAFGPSERFSKRDLRQYRNMRMLSGLVGISSFALAIGWGNQLCTPTVESVSLPTFERTAYTSLAVSGVMIDNSSSHRIKLAMPFQKIFQKKAITRLGKWQSYKDPKNKGLQPFFGILLCLSGLILNFFVFLGYYAMALEGAFSLLGILLMLAVMAAGVGLFYLAAQKFFPNASRKYHKRFAWLASLAVWFVCFVPFAVW